MTHPIESRPTLADVGEPIDLRERTRNAVRAQLADAARRLFVEQGFEATTVEQIAAATGLSRRSFHRYFSNKEDVLTQWFAEIGEQVAAALAARPADEPAWVALRRSLDDLVEEMNTRPDALVMTRMMLTSPALYASHLQKHAHWRDLMADVLQQRPTNGDEHPDRIAATALASAALGSLDAAQAEWVSDGNRRPLGELLDEAMNAVAPLA